MPMAGWEFKNNVVKVMRRDFIFKDAFVYPSRQLKRP
jgi:hypothetical protein